jgi:hypothetical protein
MQAAWFVWAAVLVQLVAVTLAGPVVGPGRPPTLVSRAEAAGLPAITLALFVVCAARMYVGARHELRELDDTDRDRADATPIQRTLTRVAPFGREGRRDVSDRSVTRPSNRRESASRVVEPYDGRWHIDPAKLGRWVLGRIC